MIHGIGPSIPVHSAPLSIWGAYPGSGAARRVFRYPLQHCDWVKTSLPRHSSRNLRGQKRVSSEVGGNRTARAPTLHASSLCCGCIGRYSARGSGLSLPFCRFRGGRGEVERCFSQCLSLFRTQSGPPAGDNTSHNVIGDCGPCVRYHCGFFAPDVPFKGRTESQSNSPLVVWNIRPGPRGAVY